jgi:hypothetical protein
LRDDHRFPGLSVIQLSSAGAAESTSIRPCSRNATGNPAVVRFCRLKKIPWLLVIILGFQAYLSCRLVNQNTTFVDEATYLIGGHQEIHSIVGNGSATVPGHNGYYQAYFSGAPVLYPVLAAIADSLGGLAGARLLSLPFMLGATTFLYCTTCCLYSRRAAILGSGVFAVLSSTQFLGAFATYDAMALCTIGLATFLSVKSAEQGDNELTLLQACAAMVAADTLKYAAILFNPVIIGMCVLVSARDRGWRNARRQGCRMIGYSVTMGAALLAVGGQSYIKGMLYSTLARAQGNNSVQQVISETWHLIGFVMITVVVAVIMSFLLKQHSRKWLSVLLLVAVFLAPINQAHIHTLTSLQKHVDYGAWFGSISAGYVLSMVLPETRVRTARILTLLLAGTGMIAASLITAPQALKLYHGWTNATDAVAALKPWVRNVNILAEDYFIYGYYLYDEVPVDRWNNTWELIYEDPTTGKELVGSPAYTDSIMHHYFGTIALSFGTTAATDKVIVAAMKQAGGYIRVAHIRYGRDWFDVYHYSSGN